MREFRRLIRALRSDAPLTPYDAGYDAALKGPNERNCHLLFFNTEKRTSEWDRGAEAGQLAKLVRPAARAREARERGKR